MFALSSELSVDGKPVKSSYHNTVFPVHGFFELVKNTIPADVTLVVGEEKMPVHTIVLLAWSSKLFEVEGLTKPCPLASSCFELYLSVKRH